MSKLPEVLNTQIVTSSRLFKVEEMQLRFSNGVERTYERLVNQGYGAVLVVALTKQQELVLVNEYAGGLQEYVLAFPKGAIDAGEGPLEAANRELKEEAGFGAHKLEVLTSFSLAPNHMQHKMYLVLAQDLYPCSLEGDEPEPLEVILHPLKQWKHLLAAPSFHEARSIAALFLANEKLTANSSSTL